MALATEKVLLDVPLAVFLVQGCWCGGGGDGGGGCVAVGVGVAVGLVVGVWSFEWLVWLVWLVCLL